jgi:hypothetical protein
MSHRWKVFRAGGVDQVAIGTRGDLEHLEELDPKLWIALSMPTRGVHVDARTLEHLDTDGDGQIRRPEVLAAVAWCRKVYKDPAAIFAGGDAVALDQLADGPVLAGARRLLDGLGRAGAKQVTLADAAGAAAVLVGTRQNGDGVITADAAEGDARAADVRAAIEAILATHGSIPDRSGQPGVDRARIDAFLADAKAYLAWHDAADPAAGELAAAAAAVAAVREKVDDFFTRCRLARFDPRAAAALAPTDGDLAALAGKTLSLASAEVAGLPLARIAADGALPLDGAVNPAWQARIATLVAAAVAPLLVAGADAGQAQALTEVDWQRLVDRVAGYQAWQAARPAGAAANAIDALGIDRLRAAIAQEAAVLDVLARDLAAQAGFDAIADVERLCRYQRDLGTLLGNYVNFSRFYARQGAVFQAGTLYLDARGCTLVFEVIDPAKHATLAPMAGTYLAYCDCTRAGGATKKIAAAFTAGDVDHLFVGRNGVLVDRDGLDWAATITKIVESPLSIRQAFWTPYKRLARSLEERAGKRAAAAETASQGKLDAGAAAVSEAGKPPAGADAAQAKKPAIDVGTVAALGVAVGGIAAVVVAILSGVFGLGKWAPLAILGIMLAISAPSMLLAYLKLRRRNLGPLLDANGWAINALTRINVPFGAALTERAALPAHAERSLADPYAERRRPWKRYVALLAILGLGAAWYFGKLDGYLPDSLTRRTVLGDGSGAAPLPPAPPAPAPPATPPATPPAK